MNVLLLPYRLFEDLYVFRWPLQRKKKYWAESLVALYEQILYVFPVFVFYYCVIENMQHVYCTWLNALFALVAFQTASSRSWTENTSSYRYKDVLFPVYVVCMLSKHVKNLCMVLKTPPDVKHGESDLSRSKPASIVCFPVPHLFPVLHVARHIGSKAEL